MKIIFLDIDGVLNDASFLASWLTKQNDIASQRAKQQGNVLFDWIRMINPKAVSLLNEAIEKTGADIVISSSWRVGHTKDQMTKILEKAGFKGKIIGCTTTRMINATRGQEIQHWLDMCPADKFVILDDEDDMDNLEDHLVQTTFEKGLQKEHIDKIVEMLK